MGAIGDVFGSIFGTKKAVDNILDKDSGLLVKFGGFIDDLSHTDAEKSREKRDFAIKWMAALEPFKIVQRILAFAATFLWVLVGINVLAAFWVEAINPEIKIVDELISFAVSEYVAYPVMICYALYFGGGTIESLKKR